MLKPARSLVLLAGGWLALAVLAAFRPGLALFPWKVTGWTLGGILLLDLLLLWRLPKPSAERRVNGTLPVGVWSEVRLRLAQASPIPLRLMIFDDLPSSFEYRGQPTPLRLSARGWGELGYRVKPLARGAYAFGALHVLLRSPFGLWWRRCRIGKPTSIKVFPNFAPVKKYAELAVGHRLTQLGIHRRRRRGEGSEFHQLREFRDGDSLRQIDWKATARMRRLISKDYQEERDQQVLFLLDCGRRMRTREGSEEDQAHLSHFDHTLTALLLLAYVALREGDAVGLLTFAGASRWLPPRKSPAALDDLLQLLYDLQPTPAATDYLAAAEAALGRLKKRALVVLITNLRDEDDDTLGPALRLLRRRHRVVLASLRERDVEAVLETSVHGFDQALLHGSIHAYLDQRRTTFERLDAKGTLCLDTLPEQLPVALVNAYLALKRSGAL